ncbi:DUF1499 domain-containing protein [Psychrobacter sp. 16-MNA-CIBAN-0192]|uniref:DUF1499 domain-containing protein n=1 Tax=Psychrobacter sp. 16-MNA-CIBAN-0192 TaxID=3140448 RepID=UPI003322B949
MKIFVSLMSLIALLLVVLPGPLHKFDVINLSTAFMGFKFGIYAGVTVLILLGLQFLFMRKTTTIGSAIIAILCAAIAIALPLVMISKGKSVPPIHDISTDLVNPPEFVAIAPLRADAPNPVAYDGAQTAEQQRQAYPELETLNYAQSKTELMSAMEQAINNLGWELVNIDLSTGIIEATETTTWFGFKDDIIVRIHDTGDERLIDIRSKSRVGASDLGKNAARIHTLIKELNAVLY